MDPDGPHGRRCAVRVAVSDGRGRRMRAPGLARWLTRIAPPRARGLVSVAIVSDAQIQRLNRRFRGVDRPTDVLSFPNVGRPFQGRRDAGLKGPRYGGPRAPSSGRPRSEPRDPSPESRVLGDIVIARGVARRQAREAGHSELTEWRVLALHGLLHLMGYDHERDAGLMRRAERRLRRKGGLREGLIDRAGPRQNDR